METGSLLKIDTNGRNSSADGPTKPLSNTRSTVFRLIRPQEVKSKIPNGDRGAMLELTPITR